MYNDVQAMLLQSDSQKFIFQQSGEISKIFPSMRTMGAPHGDSKLSKQ